MAAIVYLDVDDEITSAAARIRSSEQTRVVLVVPYGSRLATSRINFRLLAREAQARGRTLAIVAPDAATRALAGSAGLDTYAAVADFEAGVPAAKPPVPGAVVAGATAMDAAATAVMPTPASAIESQASSGAENATAAAAPWSDRISLPVVHGLRRRFSGERTPLAIGAAAVALAFLVVGVGAYLLLPTATISLTPRVDPVGPLTMTVTADPSATEPDADRGVIPAQRLTYELTSSDLFLATGSRVESDPATGQVTFANYDPTERNVVPAGSIVSTEGGIRFRTTAAVSVPAGTFVLPEVVPGKATIGIAAVRPGTEGNVPANAITVVPSDENPIFLRVNNEQPTAGGARREFRRIAPRDVTAALEALTVDLRAQFDAILADPATVPAGATLYPESQNLAEGTPTTDPTTLAGQEVDSFELAMETTATVLAVDPAPMQAVADARVRDRVSADHAVVEGSVAYEVGAATVGEELIFFPVTARASQVRVLDEAALLAEIKGKPIPQARSILETFGEVDIDAWPAWVTSIPTLDARLDLQLVAPIVPQATIGPSGPTGPSPPQSSSPVPASPQPSAARPSASP